MYKIKINRLGIFLAILMILLFAFSTISYAETVVYPNDYYECTKACGYAQMDCRCVSARKAWGTLTKNQFIACSNHLNKECDAQRIACDNACKYGGTVPAKTACPGEEDKNGCCPGYAISNFNVCCKEGYEALKGDNGNIFCDMIVEDQPDLKSIDVKVGKKNFVYGQDENIAVTFTFKWEDKEGKDAQPSVKTYPGEIVVKATNSDNIKFFTRVESPVVDSSGKLSADIRVSSANLKEEDPDEIKVEVYNTEMPDSKDTFTLTVADMTLKSFRKLSEGPTWQDSWGTYEIVINDPKNRKKSFFLAPSQGIIRYDEEEARRLRFKTKSNTIKFGWKAPKISKEMRINYANKVVSTALEVALANAGDAGKNKVNDKLKKYKGRKTVEKRITDYTGGDSTRIQKTIDTLDDVQKDFDRANKMTDASGKLAAVDNYVKALSDEAKNTKYLQDNYITEEGKDQEWWYRRYKVLLETAIAVEGVGGFPGPAKMTLTALKAFNDVIDEMRKIGASKKITQNFDLYIQVTGKGKAISTIKPLEAEGFEMILAEEKYIPLT